MIKQDLNQPAPLPPDLARTRPRLAIVVPCFNEELVIAETVGRLLAVLRDLQEKGQVAAESGPNSGFAAYRLVDPVLIGGLS